MNTDKRGRTPGGTSAKKRTFGRKKKHKGFRRKVENAPSLKRKRSTSSSKISESDISRSPATTRNRIINIDILFHELEKLIVCAKCHGKIRMTEGDIRGLGAKINIVCKNCNGMNLINTSKQVGSSGNAYEVNRRSVLAMRALGQGHAGLETFCGIMDLPSPVAHSFYDHINEELSKACEKVAVISMQKAVEKEKQLTPAGSVGLDVSGDGSWRKRGFSSLQGITSLIGLRSQQILDISIKNSFCKACMKWENREGTEEYEDWYTDHQANCSANHEGSAGKMETDGIIEIFKRSMEKYGVKYHRYIGDGDSKVFSDLCKVKPYGDELIVEKKECVGHVQKRMGTRLRNLKKNSGKKKLADGKSIGGQGRLTGKVIDQLTTYYGNAIRGNTNSVKDMSNAIWATYYHKISTDKSPQHHLCPKGENSWCKWQKAKAQKKLKGFHHTSSIPTVVMEQLKQIYEDLSRQELLERCLGGFTQNSNESFNHVVWKLVTKASFSGVHVLKTGVYIAITCFNDGRIGFLEIMDAFEIKPGVAAIEWVKKSNDKRLFYAERNAEENTLESRRKRRRVRLQLPEESYEPGSY